jgi:phosphatidylserine decarboxylase
VGGTNGAERGWRLARGAGLELGIAGAALLGLAAAWAVWRSPWLLGLTALSLAVWCALLFFFRDPPRAAPQEPGVILAPADGRVLEVERVEEPVYLNGLAQRISIFLSILDVHVNRAPISGTVELVRHVPGSFRQAFRSEASEANEHNLIGIRDARARLLVRQIAGALARRVVCWVSPGDSLRAGQRIGVIKFGSRVELFLPPEAQVVVRPGDRVRGGLTAVAHLEPHGIARQAAGVSLEVQHG